MACWGIGAYYNEDKSKDFIINEGAYIGWDEKDARSIHKMFSTIKLGDIIYIKSKIIKGNKLRIKAIGVVLDNDIFTDALGTGMKVKWLNTDVFDIELSKCNEKNNVYNNTLYEEYNPIIIKKILDKIF